MIAIAIALLLAIAAGPIALAVLLALMFPSPALALAVLASVAGEHVYEAVTVVILAYLIVCTIDDVRGRRNLRRAA